MSDYPNGFTNGLTIRGLPLTTTNPGKVWWVNGSTVLAENGIGGSDGNKGTYQQPFATIDYAIGRCTASRGDIIMVMPGHSETITTDGGIACDVAGVAIVGLGTGTARAKVVVDAEAAAVTVSAANVSMINLVFEASFADITNAIDVTATDLTLLNCEFTEEGANLNWADIINASSTTDNTADGLHIEGCVSTAIDAGLDSVLVCAADIDRLVIKDCVISHQHADALHLVEMATGKDITDCLIDNNRYAVLDAAGAVMIVTDTTTANNGFVTNNHISSRDTADELTATAGTNFTFSQNFSSSVIDKSGYLLPATDS